MKNSIVPLVTLCATLASAAGAAPPTPADPVVDWNKLLLQMVRMPGVQPATVHPTRSFALMHTAMYDAVNAIDRTYKPYLTTLSADTGAASEPAAAAAAAHEILLKLYPGSQPLVDAQLQKSLMDIPDGPGKEQGISLGQTVADQLLTLRASDGANATPAPYVYGNMPGDYQSPPPTSPPQPQFTHWATVKPFALNRADQFRPGPPPALTNQVYTDALNEIKLIGVRNSTNATPDRALVGRFWSDAIQNYWNEIAQTVTQARGLSVAESARLFALLNLTLADGTIAYYDAKYAYKFWRPVTAIRAADADNNPDTAADPEWLPETVNTAPDPSYPGAHAVLSAAAAQVLALFFQNDQFDLKVTSEVWPGVERPFSSFSGAAEEASLSRIWAGQHFRFDEVAGGELGRAVAEFVVERFLTAARPERGYVQRNLVSDLPGLADRVDPNLANPWGLALSSDTPFWIADNHTGLSSIYAGDGSAIGAIRIPGPDGTAGAPTGVVFNNTSDFALGPGQPARFIFAGEDGTVTAWSSGTNAVLLVNNSPAHAIYKGLAIATEEGAGYLYATDFHNNRVDVFGQVKTQAARGAFLDPDLPAGFAPFGVATIGTNLFVTYALQDDDKEDDVAGPGNGFVDVYDTKGVLLRRFASRGPLNSPWGIVKAPGSFGEFGGALLIGNFGDGRINTFDPSTGAFLGALKGPDGAPISIEGLWGLTFGNGIFGIDANSLYFTAGIAGSGEIEDHGLFGFIFAPSPVLLSVSAAREHFVKLAWSGGPGQYRVQTRTNLLGGIWTDVMTTTNLSVTVPANGPTDFFRVVRP